MRFPAKIASSCIWVAIPVDSVILHWYACGADGLAFGRCTVMWLPSFPGWVDLHPSPARGAPLWFGFPAPRSLNDLNLNSDKTYKVTPFHGQWYDRITSINANSLLDSQRLLGFVRGGGEVQTIFVLRKIVWTSAVNIVSRYQTSCLSSPGWSFFCADDRKPKLFNKYSSSQNGL